MGFKKVDHVTNNAMSMASVTLWMEHVMGMEQCWEIEFHTDDINEGASSGTGLKSIVMWDPRSGIVSVNEPLQPFFKEGQINTFVEDNHGPGIQHIALEVDDAVTTVRELARRGVKFLDTPGVYYDLAPERLRERGVDVPNRSQPRERPQTPMAFDRRLPGKQLPHPSLPQRRCHRVRRPVRRTVLLRNHSAVWG